MCITCSMSLLEDHERSTGPLCVCKRFHAALGSEGTCFHCFDEANAHVADCPVCAPTIPTVFFQLDLADELTRVRRMRARSSLGRYGVTFPSQ